MQYNFPSPNSPNTVVSKNIKNSDIISTGIKIRFVNQDEINVFRIDANAK